MKISDFLELPTNEIDLYQAMTYDTTHEEDKAIANCVNHADALADALADLIEQSTNYAANFKSEYYSAIDALEAYRGVK